MLHVVSYGHHDVQGDLSPIVCACVSLVPHNHVTTRFNVRELVLYSTRSSPRYLSCFLSYLSAAFPGWLKPCVSFRSTHTALRASTDLPLAHVKHNSRTYPYSAIMLEASKISALCISLLPRSASCSNLRRHVESATVTFTSNLRVFTLHETAFYGSQSAASNINESFRHLQHLRHRA